MRALVVLKKCVRDQFRDVLTLLLTIFCASFFVLLYKVMLPDEHFACRVLIVDQTGDPSVSQAFGSFATYLEDEVAAGAWKGRSADLEFAYTDSVESGRRELRSFRADALMIVDQSLVEFSRSPETPSIRLEFEGDPASTQYQLSVLLITASVRQIAAERSSREPQVVVVEHALGVAGEMTRFENYVPGLLFVSIILLVFGVAIAVSREIEANTMARLRLTHLRASELLAGYTVTYLAIGIVSILLTLTTAYALGFDSYGSVAHDIGSALLLCGLTSFPVIGIGLMVAATVRSVTQAFLVSVFPVLLLLFFSGAFYPMQRIIIARMGGLEIGVFDILPPTHAVTGLKKLLIFGAGFEELTYELVALVALSAIYFMTGTMMFRRRFLH